MIRAKITDTELLSHLSHIEKDAMHVFVAEDGLFRGSLLNGTKLVNQMRIQHNTGILETFILGQACLATAVIIQTMKGREHLQIRYETDGPAKGFSVEADSTGYVRGFLLQNPIPVDAPLENWSVEPFFGNGVLSISRFSEVREGETAKPQTGMVEIKHKDIAKDLVWYFQQSEQIQTAIQTSIRFDKKGRVIGAGALFVQRMPANGGIPSKNKAKDIDALTARMENAINACPSLGQWFSENQNAEDIIYGLFREFKPSVALQRSVFFDCPCSKEKYADAIRKLPLSDIDDMKKNGPDPLEIICNNCSSIYHIPVKEL